MPSFILLPFSQGPRKKNFTFPEFYKLVRRGYYLMLGGVILCSCVYFAVPMQVSIADRNMARLFTFFVPAITLVLTLMSNTVYSVLCESAAKDENDTRKKLLGYNTASLLRFLLLETPAVVTLFAYLITGDAIFSIFHAVLILIFLFSRPTRAEIIARTRISESEIEDLK